MKCQVNVRLSGPGLQYVATNDRMKLSSISWFLIGLLLPKVSQNEVISHIYRIRSHFSFFFLAPSSLESSNLRRFFRRGTDTNLHRAADTSEADQSIWVHLCVI